MPLVQRPIARCVSGAVLALAALGCKAKPKPAPPTPVASASASVKLVTAEPPARCRSVGNGVSLRVGEASPKAPAPADDVDESDAGEDDDDTALPFATRVDSALALDDSFAVGGLATQGNKTEAFVGFVPIAGGAGRRVGLGVVHGDVDPPLVAGRGRTLVVAVSDMDAGGGMLRLHGLESGADKPSGDASITGVEHDVGAALALGEHGGVLVWGAKRAKGVGLKMLALDPAALAGPFSPRELDGTLNAESPALVARPGGFWLTWVSEQPAVEHADAGAHADAARGDAGSRADGGAHELDDDGKLVEAGPRVLMTLPLDATGKPSGAPRAVSGVHAHVVGFEAALLPDGALSVAWREDDASPGAESGPPELARMSLDGALQHEKLEDDDLTAGLPVLLTDSSPGGRVWVALVSASGGTRVGVLKEGGLALDALVGDRLLRGVDVLAAGAGKLLVSRNRGRAVELEVLECSVGP